MGYAAWPTAADVSEVLASAGITIRAGTSSAYIDSLVDGVVAKLTQQTKRQFLKGSAGEVRYFDGSGTGRQLVDEFVAFTDIQILGYLGTGGINLANCVKANINLYPTTEIFIYRGSLPGIGRVWMDVFPAGRQNIQVTGTWGYPEIPSDVWEAVRRSAAAWVGEESIYSSTGRLKRWMELDTMEERDLNLPGDVLGWYKLFKEVVSLHRKPLQVHLERGRPRMV